MVEPVTIGLAAASIGSGIIGAMMQDDNEFERVETMSPEQKRFFAQYMALMKKYGVGADKAMSLLEQYMNPDSQVYKAAEAPYRRQFEQETIPKLSEQFAGAGGATGGALSSSGFGQALSSAGAGLQTNLAQMKNEMMRNAINDYLTQYNQMSNTALNTKTFDYVGGGGGSPAGGFLSNISPGLMNAALSSYQSSQNQKALGGYKSAPTGGMQGSGRYGLPNFMQGY